MPETQDQATTTTSTTAGPTTTPAPTTTGAPKMDGGFERPDNLWFVGEKRPDGQPVEHLAGYGLPARHIRKGEAVWRHLSDEVIKLALDSGLYRRTRPDKKTDPWNDEPDEPAAKE